MILNEAFMSEPQEPMSPESCEKARASAKLVRETEWMRVYELGPKRLQYESKFLRNEIQMSADSFATRWPSMPSKERYEFVFAYHAKGNFTADDEQIVEKIMQDGDDRVWSGLALFMIRHPERERVLAFLRARLKAKPEHPFNYIQALGEAEDPEALPIIRSYFDEFRSNAETERLSGALYEPWNSPGWSFLICCEALWKITNSSEYLSDLRNYQNHPNSSLRNQATRALEVQR